MTDSGELKQGERLDSDFLGEQTRENIDRIEVGEILEVLADDPAAEEDIKRFVKRTGHQIINFEKKDDSMRFLIKKTK